MSKILVIGARGRAGRAALSEALGRGHEVVQVARTAGSGPGQVARDKSVVGDGSAVGDGLVGLASILPTADGTLLMDTEGYPSEYRSFFLAHQTALDVFAASSLDWVSIAPTGDFDHADPARKGSYRVAPADAREVISYADLAIALIDEVDHPAHHRAAIGVVA